MQKIKSTQKLANGRFHTFESHSVAMFELQKIGCIHPQSLVDQTKMAAFSVVYVEMVT